MKDLLTKTENTMQRRIDHLESEYARIRAGRANAGVLDKVLVDYYGSSLPQYPLPKQELLQYSPGTLPCFVLSRRQSRCRISVSILRTTASVSEWFSPLLQRISVKKS